jgi:hypothetical protein
MKNVNALFGIADHCHVEVMTMRWLKRNLWKISIIIADILILLVLMVWVLLPTAGAHEVAPPGHASAIQMGMVQATPTEDATVTALNEEKLKQEVKQLQEQNEPDLFGWLRTNAAILLSTLVVVIGGLIGLFRWFRDRRDAQEKDLKAQAEERFRTAVTALGDEKEGVQVGGAILLRSFLHKEDKKSHERYYTQIFDLAVAYLRPSSTSHPSEDPDGTPQSPVASNTPLPLTTLRQALIVVFREAFPLARERRKKRQTLESSFLQKINAWLERLIARLRGIQTEERFDPQSLDASRIQLDKAYLSGADLNELWIPLASLREADLGGAHLCKAKLRGADLRKARLDEADLSEANLSEADLSGIRNLEDAKSLKDTDLRGVTGLDDKQKKACKAKGANIDEDPPTSSPPSTTTPPPSSQSNDVQTPSSPPAQGSLPPPDTDGSSGASSQQEPKS